MPNDKCHISYFSLSELKLLLLSFKIKIMAGEENFWKNFEHFLGYQLPQQIKNTLSLCGFEKYVSRDYDPATAKFNFLPGHRALLLNLPKKNCRI